MNIEVRAEVSGVFQSVGEIRTLSGTGEQFSYSRDWLEAMGGVGISLSLPSSDKVYMASEMRPYFEGLLPEEDARKSIARSLGVSSNSYLKLLAALAGECIGAVSLGEEDEDDPTESMYLPISDEELASLEQGGYAQAGKFARRSRLSLAGAQAKTGLYHDETSGGWYMPRGLAPSTHVVKPTNPVFDELVQNELWCMSLAKASGIPVAEACCIVGHPGLLAVKRYDRVVDGGSHRIQGLPVPRRLHQEDFCQALGLLGRDKYEERGEQHLATMFKVLEQWSSNPLEDRNLLIDLVAFDVVIGNCDAHLKNYSLLRSSDWRQLRLAPAYDLVSTAVYEDLTQMLGMRVGDTKCLDDVSRQSFEDLARQVGMAPRGVLRRVDDVLQRIREGLKTMSADGEIEAKCAARCMNGLVSLAKH